MNNNSHLNLITRRRHLFSLVSSFFVMLILSCSVYVVIAYLIPNYYKSISVCGICKVEKHNNYEKNPRYVELYNKGKEYLSSGDYVQAKAMFEMLKAHDYLDSKELYQKSLYKLAEQYMQNEEFDKASQIFATIYNYADSEELRKECNYEHGLKYYNKNDYGNALSAFTYAGNYKDTKDYIIICSYRYALTLLCEKKYLEAIELFSTNPDYKDTDKYIKEAKYGYAKNKLCLHDEVAYKYTIELYNMGYEGSEELYNYYLKCKWKIKIMVNRTAGNYVTDLDSIPADCTWYFNISTTEGNSDQRTRLRYVGVFPDGREIGDYWNFDFYDNTYSWASFRYEDGYEKKTGIFRFYIYTDTGILLGMKEIEIV